MISEYRLKKINNFKKKNLESVKSKFPGLGNIQINQDASQELGSEESVSY